MKRRKALGSRGDDDRPDLFHVKPLLKNNEILFRCSQAIPEDCVETLTYYLNHAPKLARNLAQS
jgi:hypothetical protein